MHPRYLWGPTLVVAGAILMAALGLIALRPSPVNFDDEVPRPTTSTCCWNKIPSEDEDESEVSTEQLLCFAAAVMGPLLLGMVLFKRFVRLPSDESKLPASASWLDPNRHVPVAENDPLILNRLRYFQWVVGSVGRKPS